jgi:hypothetical protein
VLRARPVGSSGSATVQPQRSVFVAPPPRKTPRQGVLWVTLFVLVGATLGVVVKLKNPNGFQEVVDKIPALQKWFSKLPPLPDLSAQDIDRLKEVIRVPLDRAGPLVEMALSKEKLQTPVFHVTSNLPNGARIEIYIQAIVGTLLNQNTLFTKSYLEIKDHYGKTEPVQQADGKPLPKGKYQVLAVDAQSQPEAVQSVFASLKESNTRLLEGISAGRKLVVQQIFFLGGEEDDQYKLRLKTYLDELQKKSDEIFGNLKQLTLSIRSQRDRTAQVFQELTKNPKQLKFSKIKWSNFHKEWAPFQERMTKDLEGWTDELIVQRGFYKELHQQVKAKALAISAIHHLQNEFFEGRAKLDEINPTIIQKTDELVKELELKISETEAQPAPTNGLPKGLEVK